MYSIFFRVFIIAASFFSAIISNAQEQTATIKLNKAHAPLVKNLYPNAQRWFEAVSKKYPEARLSNVSFYVSTCCRSESNAIYWQEDRLRKINVAYGSHANLDSIDAIFKQDEYILLHEAGHILKNHDKKAYIALALTTVAFAVANGYIVINATLSPVSTALNWSTLSLTALLANAAIFSSLFYYIQSQENEADAFANNHADYQALLAGSDYLDLCIAHDQKLASLTEQLICTHPPCQNRQEKISQSIASRFNNK